MKNICNTRRPRIALLGFRGFPNVQGGVERHAEHLAVTLVELGCDVLVIGRSPYKQLESETEWKCVKIKWLWAPRSKSLEAIVHTLFGVLYLSIRRPDVLHIQAIGPALLTPLARILGLRVVMTHHGPDYDRQKWGMFAKLVLRLGEALGVKWSNKCIVISNGIKKLVNEKYKRDTVLIPNGVVVPAECFTDHLLERYGLKKHRYIIMVSRLVPEKRHHDAIEAFRMADLEGWKFVLVGGSDHPDQYSQELLEYASQIENVVCTGIKVGKELHELFSHAGMFILSSTHEGLPIAMLEALSYGLPVIASDIPANREVGLAEESYYPVGDAVELAAKINEVAGKKYSEKESRKRKDWVAARYDWRRIAEQTVGVYESLIPGTQN